MLFMPESKENRESLTAPDTSCWVIKRVELLPSSRGFKQYSSRPQSFGLHGAVGRERTPRQSPGW